MVQRDLYMEQIIPLIDNELIKVITGIRRCGKSYMLGLIKEELIKRGVKEHNIIIINFDSKKYKNIKNNNELDKIVEKSIKNKKGKVYLFFDEIQNVKKWELSIAGYKVDYDCDIYITGSNSKLLSGELATHLTGRYYEIKMYPFSYQEFLNFR
ncbi:MAG: AAA family ATPase, partial [Methanobrevibacter sp.]|nr:AAA family ATPase [Methanobrevibacter sp.]